MNEPDDLLTTAEVARILRAPVSTVRYWRYLNTGPKWLQARGAESSTGGPTSTAGSPSRKPLAVGRSATG